MRCGYPASSIRERIYADSAGGHYGILLYTGSPDAEGTLGGLVQEARNIEQHLEQARTGARFEVVPEPRLERGAAIFETSRGSLDASVETQLDEIQRGLIDRIRV